MKFEIKAGSIKIDQQALESAIAPAVKEIADSWTAAVDELVQSHKGRSVDEIKHAIVQLFERRGGSISDPELTQYAEYIQRGERLVFTPGAGR